MSTFSDNCMPHADIAQKDPDRASKEADNIAVLSYNLSLALSKLIRELK